MTERASTAASDQSEDEYLAISELFVDGSPDFGVLDLSVARCALYPVDDADSMAAGRDWSITGVVTRRPAPALILFGDLTVRDEDWFVGTTVSCAITFRDDRVIETDEEAREVTERLGTWMGNILYDTASSASRRLVGSNSACEIEVPSATLRPKIAHVFGGTGEG